MKIDRLVSILSVLLQKEKVTTTYLAEKFEVSKRTILRDIDSLNKAGIPIVTTQGNGGGVSIMENYKLDKTLLSSQDLRSIIAGLKGLDSVSGGNQYRQLMEKLHVDSSAVSTLDNHCNGCHADDCAGAKWCEARKCCMDKCFEHCYACSDAETCQKGILAKLKPHAFTVFAKQNGEEKLIACLERNRQNGIVYHRNGIFGDYDDCNDTDELIRMILGE